MIDIRDPGQEIRKVVNESAPFLLDYPWHLAGYRVANLRGWPIFLRTRWRRIHNQSVFTIFDSSVRWNSGIFGMVNYNNPDNHAISSLSIFNTQKINSYIDDLYNSLKSHRELSWDAANKNSNFFEFCV